jgi:two-component system sensor histidine kinase KdpD
LNDQIWQSTGIRVRETIPDWVLKQADEVVMVDLTPRALLNRLARGAVYPPERAREALQNFFKESTLVALRELAMRHTAHAVESRQAPDQPPADPASPPQTLESRERLLLVISPDPSTAALIRRGRRVADYLRAECLAIYVAKRADLQGLMEAERASLERQLNFARGLQIETRVLEGADVAQTVVNLARNLGVTQIFVTRDKPGRMRSFLAPGLVQRIVKLARDMQVTVVADRSMRRPVTA